MRVVVAGTRSFGMSALTRILLDGHEVPLVVAPLEDKLHSFAALGKGIPVADRFDADQIRSLNADLIVAAHCHAYIGQHSRAATRYGALVGHPSLLPRHRGKSSVEWTVRMNDPISGFTWFWADRGVDTGAIAVQDWCHVDPRWSASDLWSERLFPMGISLLSDVLMRIALGDQPWVPQDPAYATFEPSVEAPPLHRPELTALPPGRRA